MGTDAARATTVEAILERALHGEVSEDDARRRHGLGITVSQVVSILPYHLHAKLTPGGLIAMWMRLAVILEPWYDEIGRQARASAVLHADETGWRVEGQTCWLWCFASAQTCYYSNPAGFA